MEYDGLITKPTLEELYHHGIRGQKWGVKNGPPYPLDKGRKQTKYGFKGRGGAAYKVSKVAAKVAGLVPGALTTTLIADARAKSYKPGETTDKHYIKKGTKMYRVSSVDKENNIGETYVTYNPVDRAFYRAYIKNMNPDSKVYETTFKATQDLTVPSQKELAEVQKKVIWDNPKLKKESIEGYANFRAYKDYKKESIKDMRDNYDNLNKLLKGQISKVISYGTDDPSIVTFTLTSGKKIDIPMDKMIKYNLSPVNAEKAFRYDSGTALKEKLLKQVKNQEISAFSIISTSMGTSKELKEAMIKELKSRGFNSMVDEAGVGALEVPGVNDKKSGRVSREGVEPIIVFDREESLKPIKTKTVGNTDEDIRYYNRWRANKDNAYRKITW